MMHIFRSAFTLVVFTFAFFVSFADPVNNDGAATEIGKSAAINQQNDTGSKKPNFTTDINCTSDSNRTECNNQQYTYSNLWNTVIDNRDMLLRTMYVLLSVTGVVIVYFIVRAWRLRRQRNKSRKYGVITTRGDLEMEPLGEGEDDDEDYTVFEVNGKSKK